MVIMAQASFGLEAFSDYECLTDKTLNRQISISLAYVKHRILTSFQRYRSLDYSQIIRCRP